LSMHEGFQVEDHIPYGIDGLGGQFPLDLEFQGVVERPLGPLWVETSGEVEDGTSGTGDWDAFDLGAMVRREVARVVYDGDPTNSAGRGPAPAHMHLGGREAR